MTSKGNPCRSTDCCYNGSNTDSSEESDVFLGRKCSYLLSLDPFSNSSNNLFLDDLFPSDALNSVASDSASTFPFICKTSRPLTSFLLQIQRFLVRSSLQRSPPITTGCAWWDQPICSSSVSQL
ncbi:hypothetical protein ATANTOWER_016759 [Ataeniobius toweri]|uniref:Uncharacterized protein n=1 Tax=Ataeniobius toweri TaxID=208326 RepID=A0ABU7A2X0_9TELE|nr:hypothetical protein [Ataeniobius toweri]